MNIQDLGAIGEVVGAIAVIVSILYLSIQVRANARAMKATASFDATHSWATLNEQLFHLEDPIIEAAIKSYEGTDSWDDFTPVMRTRLGIMHRALFQKLEGQFYLHAHGFLEPDVWAKRSSWAAGLIRIPFYSKWWQDEKDLAVFTDAFVQAIESTHSVKVMMTGAGSNG
jgi:hypothetical protein